MGCDIHSYVEIRKDGQWEHYNWYSQFQKGIWDDGSPEYDYSAMFNHPLYIHRNYDLFAILANVRNGRGFAGISTGTGFKPISMPRGLPGDVTFDVKKESDNWGADGHSHSYVTLRELLEYDWEGQVTTHFGVVDEEEYQAFKSKGEPLLWAGDISGRSIIKISNAEMDLLLTGDLERKEGIRYYTTIKWDETYLDSVGKHWFITLDELKKLGSPEDVRLVFWFDN